MYVIPQGKFENEKFYLCQNREGVDEVYAGDAGSYRSQNTTTGDTMSKEEPVILESMEFPDPIRWLSSKNQGRSG